MFLFCRITVPKGAEEQRRSVPFQLLLLLEKMQDSRQKAVRPMELAYCLQKYNVPCKTGLLLISRGGSLKGGKRGRDKEREREREEREERREEGGGE
jgi:hypothetical protein